MLQEALWDVDEEICAGGHLIKSLRFADDQATITCLVECFQDMMARMNDNAESFGMKINIKRTQVMKTSKSPWKEFTIMLGGKELAQVKQFTYLGSIVTQEGDCGRDIRTRIASVYFWRNWLPVTCFLYQPKIDAICSIFNLSVL